MDMVTIPAAASAMGVSRIILERAVKAEALPVHVFHTGRKNGGFHLINATDLQSWLEGREGYHKTLKNGATKFYKWGSRKNPSTIVSKALSITQTNKAA